jgi:hypothetical protein
MLTNLAPSLVSTHPDFVAQPTISKLFTLQHAAATGFQTLPWLEHASLGFLSP